VLLLLTSPVLLLTSPVLLLPSPVLLVLPPPLLVGSGLLVALAETPLVLPVALVSLPLELSGAPVSDCDDEAVIVIGTPVKLLPLASSPPEQPTATAAKIPNHVSQCLSCIRQS